jgi:ABC-type phosphate transport system substrate-binding protein
MCAFARTLLRLLGRVPIALSLLAAVFGAGALRAQSPAQFQVIVNAANPIASLSREETSRFFLRKVVTWKPGEVVLPVDQSEDSPVRREFSKAIHHKDVAGVRRYWQELIFTGQGVPPVERANDEEVVAFVGASRGAIGYVGPTATLGRKVRPVRIVE